jgi:predicted nucleic acid-binding protein
MIWSVTWFLSEREKAISNASPLIHLAKVGKLIVLKESFEKILIPKEVFEEVCGSQDTPDSVIISDAVKEGWIRVQKTSIGGIKQLAETAGIQIGEASAILLAKKEKIPLIIDDKMGRSTATMMGVTCVGTVGVLLRVLAESIITFTEFAQILDKMVDSGFRLDIRVYREVLKLARELC